MNNNAYDQFGRPCKELYAMDLAFTVSKRSIDPSTKHGTVITDQYGGIITTGYNGPIANSIDKDIPLTRPHKYAFLEHSERNAIYFAAKKGESLENSIFYITGLPCIDCLRGILTVGASKIIYGPLTSIMHNDFENHKKQYEKLLSNHSIIIKPFQFIDELFNENIFAKKSCKNRLFYSFIWS